MISIKKISQPLKKDKPIIERAQGITCYGNKGANYLKIGRFDEEDDNRLYIEVGDCCVVIFRGIITVDAFTSILTDIACEDNKNLLEAVKKRMRWKDEVNSKLFAGSKKIDNSDMIYFEDVQ